MAKLLSILCVTRKQPYSEPFLREFAQLAEYVDADYVEVVDSPDQPFPGSKGYIESILDEAVARCATRYVLRLDDDERCPPAMVEWLFERHYLAHDHWQFPRMHMWPRADDVLLAPHLFPDYQTRLSVKEKSGGRHTLHAPSPFGAGVEAPVAIEHHKFLVRSRAEREETARRWHSGGMTVFSLPEDVLNVVKVVSRGTGVVPWVPEYVYEVQIGDDGA